MRVQSWSKTQLTKRILLALAVVSAAGTLTVALAAMPGLGKVLKEIVDWYEGGDARTRYRIRKKFAELRRKRLIETRELPDGSAVLVLSEKGERRVLRYKFEELGIQPQKRWDGVWRFAIFDLPKRFKQERELWRGKLKAFGFHQLQRSVWLYPYPCRNEMDFAAEYLGISSYVRMLEVKDVDVSEEIKEVFRLA